MSNQIQHIKISRGDFNDLTTKSDFAIYFVTEVDNSISLYTGANAVSEDIRMVDTLPATGDAIMGKVYYNETDKTAYIYNGTAFVYLMGDVYVFHYDVMPAVTAADNGRTAIYTGNTDDALGYIQGNAYKVIKGVWTGITQESSNLQLAAPSYEGTTTITLDSVAGVGASDVAARADHTHALDASIVNAIGSVSVISSIVEEHSQAIETNASNIAINSQAIATNASNIAINSQAIASNATNIAINSQAIATNASAIAINSKAIVAVNSRVDDADAALELVNSTLDEHSGSITVMSQNIGSNAQAIRDNATAISINSAAIASNEAAIASNTLAIGVNSTTIAAVSSAVDSNTQGIGSAMTAIAINSTAIEANATAISVNSTAIAANATAISVNSTAIANHDAAITSISSALCWTIYTA